jgi:outer membrane protein assembly factor BamB
MSSSLLLTVRRLALALTATAACLPAHALTPAQLTGWWRSEVEHNGQRAEVYLRFAESDGKTAVHLSLPPIHGWDIAFGNATVTDNSVKLNAMPLVFTFDLATGTLTGVLPPDLAPATEMPVAFRKTAAPTIPKTPEWSYPSPQVEWTYAADGAVWAGLAVDAANRYLLVASDSGSVVALDARKGTRVWSFTTGDKVRARPTVADGSVFVNSDDGNLYKLEARSGKETWRARIDARPEPRPKRAPFDRHGSSALVDGARVYVGSADGALYALDARSGRDLWRVKTKEKIHASPIRSGDAVIFGSYDGVLYSVAAEDGTQRWTRDTRGAISTAPALAGERVIVGNRAFELSGLDARTGEPQWQQYYFFSWVDSVPTVADDRVYVGSSDAANVSAYDAASGRRLWQRVLGGWCWPQVAVTKERVFAGVSGAKGYFNVYRGALVALDRRNGEIVWAHVSESGDKDNWGFGAAPAIAGDTVFAADLQGRVYAFSAG